MSLKGPLDPRNLMDLVNRPPKQQQQIQIQLPLSVMAALGVLMSTELEEGIEPEEAALAALNEAEKWLAIIGAVQKGREAARALGQGVEEQS